MVGSRESSPTPLPQGQPPLPYEAVLELDRREVGESALKWGWAGLLLMVLAMFLPAASGRVGGFRPVELAGWQLAYGAHMAVYYIPGNYDSAARRVAPMSPPVAMALLATGATANWIMLTGLLIAMTAANRRDPRRGARIAGRLLLLAGLLALASAGIWFTVRGVSPRVGAGLWVLSPLFACAGLLRLARAPFAYAPPPEPPAHPPTPPQPKPTRPPTPLAIAGQ